MGPNLFQDSTHIPEGIYTLKNTTVKGCISFQLDFPNDFDKSKAIADNRTIKPYIFNLSNCLDASFQLPIDMITALKNLSSIIPSDSIQVIIAPNDFRSSKKMAFCAFCPFWIYELYGNIQLIVNDI